MIRSQLFVAAALLAGVAIGYFVKAEPTAAAERPRWAVTDRSEEATIRAQRRRVAELERARSRIDFLGSVCKAADAPRT